jgi:hypothetical protein
MIEINIGAHGLCAVQMTGELRQLMMKQGQLERRAHLPAIFRLNCVER